MFCSSCGNACEDTHVFCSQCGYRLRSTSSGMYASLLYVCTMHSVITVRVKQGTLVCAIFSRHIAPTPSARSHSYNMGSMHWRNKVYVKFTSTCIAHFYAKRLTCAQTWITHFTCKLHHACLHSPPAEHHRPLAGTHFTVPSRVEGWVDLRGWLYRNKVPPPGVEPGHGHPSQY